MSHHNVSDDSKFDVSWSMQEAVTVTFDNTIDGFPEANRPEHPSRYSQVNEGREKRKKRTKEENHRSRDSTENEEAVVNKVPGYGLGLSRGFSLWRTLNDIRRCITKVSDPLPKGQRRSLRRKLSFYVDDLERIVVGVEPQAPMTSSEDTDSSDEEIRDEVNALDEAVLKRKIVQSDNFEMRMSYLEQTCAALKKELASKEEAGSLVVIINTT